MRRPQLRFTVWWLIFAASIIGMDVAAINWVVTAKSAITARMDRGPNTARWTYYHMYDGSVRIVVNDYVTGRTIGPMVARPATTAGLCRVWWLGAASAFLTLLALAIALSRTGQWFIAELPLPQMTTRRWMMAVALLGLEFGLINAGASGMGHKPTASDWLMSIGFVCWIEVLIAILAGLVYLWIRESHIVSVWTYNLPVTRNADARKRNPNS
jgi:hypothetical protein